MGSTYVLFFEDNRVFGISTKSHHVIVVNNQLLVRLQVNYLQFALLRLKCLLARVVIHLLDQGGRPNVLLLLKAC